MFSIVRICSFVLRRRVGVQNLLFVVAVALISRCSLRARGVLDQHHLRDVVFHRQRHRARRGREQRRPNSALVQRQCHSALVHPIVSFLHLSRLFCLFLFSLLTCVRVAARRVV